MKAPSLLKRCVAGAAVGLLLAACLFGGCTVLHQLPGVEALSMELSAACHDAGTQWMVLLCAATYLIVFTLLRNRHEPEPFWHLTNPDLWLLGALAWACAQYAMEFEPASKSTDLLVLMAGAAIGQGVAAWRAWSRTRRVSGTLIVTILLLLLAASFLQSEGIPMSYYRGQSRWQGPWDNPNTFGLLMGVGLVLAFGIFLFGCVVRKGNGPCPNSLGRGLDEGQILEIQKEDGSCYARHPVMRTLAHVALVLVLMALGFTLSAGLYKSLSRGAWLGAAAGLCFLVFRLCRFQVAGSFRLRVFWCSVWMRRNKVACVVIAASLIALGFWECRHTDWHPARRAFSAGNPNDFSWRNRTVAWEGALAMMADRPVAGFGWKQSEIYFLHYYAPPRLSEAVAIRLNDYFMLAISAGIPALLAWLVFVGTALSGRWDANSKRCDENDGTWENRIKVLSQAGLLVLLVGFWFDGGLFNLPVMTVFWVLMGLGRGSQTAEDSLALKKTYGAWVAKPAM